MELKESEPEESTTSGDRAATTEVKDRSEEVTSHRDTTAESEESTTKEVVDLQKGDVSSAEVKEDKTDEEDMVMVEKDTKELTITSSDSDGPASSAQTLQEEQQKLETTSAGANSTLTESAIDVNENNKYDDSGTAEVVPSESAPESESMDEVSSSTNVPNDHGTPPPQSKTHGTTNKQGDHHPSKQNETEHVDLEEPERLRMVEEMHIGTASEILFPPAPNTAGGGESGDWDNLRWMSLSGSRKVVFSRVVFRRTKEQTKIVLWKSPLKISFSARLLVLYEYPQLLLILRRAKDLGELSTLTGADYYSTNDDTRGQQQQPQDDNKVLQYYWIVENAVDLTTCKLRLSAITTNNMSQVIENRKHEREISCFEIVAPSDTSICLSSVQVRQPTKCSQEISFSDSGAFMETISTENALTHAICQAHEEGVVSPPSASQSLEEQPDSMWKHQVILGTLHAYVLSGNKTSLEHALHRAFKALQSENNEDEVNTGVASTPLKHGRLPERVIDAPDDSNHPPIYYACKQGMNDAVSLLLQYGASLDYRTKSSKDSLLHICARNRNHKGLEILLSDKAGCVTVHPNAVNALGHTPLYTALVFGKGTPESLEACIRVLTGCKGTIFDPGQQTQPIHPILELTIQYRCRDLEVLLPLLQVDFPLTGTTDILSRLASVGNRRKTGESLAALYGYPLHRLLITFHRQIVQQDPSEIISRGGVKSKNEEAPVVTTLRLLLQCGFEANERLDDGVLLCSERFGPFVGFAPIQILAASAVAIDKVRANLSDSIHGEILVILAQLCEVLLKNGGARLSLDAPPMQRKRGPSGKAACPKQEGATKTTSEASPVPNETASLSIASNVVDRTALKVNTNEQILNLLGGRERLKAAQASYAEIKGVTLDQSRSNLLLDESTSNIEDSDAPGGSSDKSCAICWRPFGTLMNRKHRCRISWKHVCDDCSTKRVLVNGKEHRVSDGQFVRSKALMEGKAVASSSRHNVKAPSSYATKGSTTSDSEVHGSSATRARLARLEAEEKANRDSLFGGDMMEQAKNMLFGGTSEGDGEKPYESMNGMMNTLGETRNTLLERGDKLSSLSDKSAQMVSASEDFAKLATDLRKQSERGFFW